jgi:NADH-quinone oxidoreductase subunit C
MSTLQDLQQALKQVFGEDASIETSFDEVALTIAPDQWIETAKRLRDEESLRFESCIDLCVVDYLFFGKGKEGQPELPMPQFPGRYAVVAQLLSITHNCRLRIKTWPADNEFPVLSSLIDIWPAVGWYEREAFDLFGVVFEGHPDLRRILTDYGFIGHPFRKDFPISGNVEMRYDPEQGRVIYQPVTIEPREIIPRVIREDGYGIGR